MKLKNILVEYQDYLLVIAIVFSSIAIAIKSRDGKIYFLLHNHPGLIFLLVIVSSVLVVIYFHISKRKISRLSNQIREQSKIKNEVTDVRLNELTERQRRVFDLIISGMTNKEIMTELFIEQSKLKTHINQLFKKLNVQSRSELKTNFKK